jgi:hypothetical protein
MAKGLRPHNGRIWSWATSVVSQAAQDCDCVTEDEGKGLCCDGKTRKQRKYPNR